MLRSGSQPSRSCFWTFESKVGISDQNCWSENWICASTVIYACFVLYNVCEQNKVTVDGKSLKEQISLIKQNEEQFKSVPDPVYSYNEDEGEL